MRRWLWGFLALVVSFVARDAVACGLFARGPSADDVELLKATPYLSVERVLVIWDKETQTEDFIREARFEQANQSFGFVVPTPTKPEVAAVKDAPFDRLQNKVPYGSSTGRGIGGGSGGGLAEPPVIVLAQQRIGRFNAFTLQATDAGALDKWLKDSGLVVPKEAESWIRHYIKLKFYFVAFKYDSDASKGMTSETVRIRFKTPKPYYPYLDATHSDNKDLLRRRMVLGWTITRERMIDVAATPMENPRWHRPWAYGLPTDANPALINEVLGAELAALAPKVDKLVIQPFRDLKVSREGYGDVLLVPAAKSEVFSEADKDAHRLLLGVVDPTLVGEPGLEPPPAHPLPPEPPAPAPAPAPKSGCTLARGRLHANVEIALFALAAVALVRRRRGTSRIGVVPPFILFAVLMACQKPDEVADAAPAASVAAPRRAKPLSSAEREAIAFDVLMGEVPVVGITEDPDSRQLPEVTVDAGAPVVQGGKVANMDRVIAGLRARLRRCYQSALMATPELSSAMNVVMHLTLGPNGDVRTVAVEPGPPALFITCATSAAQRLEFQPPDLDGGTRGSPPTITLRATFSVVKQ